VSEHLSSVAEVFDVIATRFDPNAAVGVDAVYQFDLTGADGGTYHIRIAEGRCEVGEGVRADARITITMAASDYLDMINGVLNPRMAYIAGKLKIRGDLNLAVRMEEFFPTESAE
jgi:putative sterol carrier protein